MNMKKLIAATAALVIAGGSIPAVQKYMPDTAITANAADYETVSEGDVSYLVYSDHVKVSRCNRDAVGTMTIPSTVKGLPVTEISENAFSDCGKITKFTIPDSVKKIERQAFKQCTGAKSITIGNNVEEIGYLAFSNCDNVKEFVVPDSVKSMGQSVFASCQTLEKVELGKEMTEIPNSAFSDCTSLKEVDFKGKVTYIGSNAFFGCAFETFKVPDSVTKIDSKAFLYCTSLKSIDLGKSIKAISFEMFGSCSNLKDITIPDSVQSIEHNAFKGCKSLEEMVLGVNVLSIGQAFENCSALKSITILNDECQIESDASALGYADEIRGHKGSYAEEYANRFKYKFVAIDDAPATTKTTTKTTAKPMTTTTGTTTKTPVTTTTVKPGDLKYGDVNCDGKVDSSDIVSLSAYIKNVNDYRKSGKISAQGLINADVHYPGNGLDQNDVDALSNYVKAGIKLPITSKITGDVNNDETIDARDASAVLSYYAELSAGTGGIFPNTAEADVNVDKIIDGRDASVILTFYARASAGYKGTIKDHLAGK